MTFNRDFEQVGTRRGRRKSSAAPRPAPIEGQELETSLEELDIRRDLLNYGATALNEVNVVKRRHLTVADEFASIMDEVDCRMARHDEAFERRDY